MNSEVERVKMCVAEAGYDPSSITTVEDPYLIEQGFTFWVDMLIPPEVAWRAREVAGVKEPKCWECSQDHKYTHIEYKCRAVRRLELDCGIERKKEEETFDSIEG